MRLLQLSDLHLLADPNGLCRGRRPLLHLRHGLEQVLMQLRRQGAVPDLLLFSGDLCQDESWMGYVHLRDVLHHQLRELALPLAFLPGNHDHATLLSAALGRHGVIAPALLQRSEVDLLLLDSHRPGAVAGWLGERQLGWVQRVLDERCRRPLVVVVHHPPLPIGDPDLDAIALRDSAALLELLQPQADLQAVLFGHVHQHWQGALPDRPEVIVLGCPSTLCGFGPVQPCPLGLADHPGARLVVLEPGRPLRHQLLRWPAPIPPSVAAVD
jgi:Icc protein